MFKVISAEFKKIVSKPGIYILAVLLAILLVGGVFIYKPTVYANNAVELNGLDVLSKYSNFENDVIPNVDANIDNTINSVLYYQISVSEGYISHKDNISNLLDTFKSKLKNYLDCANNTTAVADSYMNTVARPDLVKSMENLNSAIDNAINKAKSGSYAVITTEDNYKTYTEAYNNAYSLLKTSVERNKIPEVIKDYQNKYEKDLLSSIENLKYPSISAATIKTYTTNTKGNKLFLLNERLDSIKTEITSLYKKAQNAEIDRLSLAHCNKIDELATQYVAVANTFINMVKYDLISSAFAAVSTKDQLNLLFLKAESKFNSNSLSIRYNYLFDNNKTEDSYAHPLTIGVSSNSSINAYDYAYFILRVFSFIIVVYAVMAACQTIAGEIKEGSMRYYAIRPVSRTNIYMGKMFAILLMSILMTLFSAVIAVCVGGAVYGFKSLQILTIFNGSNPIVLHPIAMLAIFLCSSILELLVYLSIALLLSCLIKSDLFAVTIMLVLYLVNILLPMFVGGANTWLTYYPFSHLSLYSLFGSTVYAVSDNFFNLIFGVKVYAATNLILTIVIVTIMIILFNLLAIKRFNKKEL